MVEQEVQALVEAVNAAMDKRDQAQEELRDQVHSALDALESVQVARRVLNARLAELGNFLAARVSPAEEENPLVNVEREVHSALAAKDVPTTD